MPQSLDALSRRKPYFVKKLFRFFQWLKAGEIKQVWLSGNGPLLFLPPVVANNKALHAVIQRAQLGKQVQIRHNKTRLGKELIDERKYIESKINRQLPGILHHKTFLVTQHFIADRIAGHISFVESPHQKLIKTHLDGKNAFFLG